MERDNALSNTLRRGRIGVRSIRRSEDASSLIMIVASGTLFIPAALAAELLLGKSLWIQAALGFSSAVCVGAVWALLLAIGRHLYPSGVDLLRTLGDRDERRQPRLILAARVAGHAFPHRVRRVWEPSVEEVHADIYDVSHRSRSVRMIVATLHFARLVAAFVTCLRIWGVDRPLAGLLRVLVSLKCGVESSTDESRDDMDGRPQ